MFIFHFNQQGFDLLSSKKKRIKQRFQLCVGSLGNGPPHFDMAMSLYKKTEA